ncbi:Crossover junction endonuclease mus81 [Nowakowskiella sp. JEL0407]|nr:Crossover junction endonuclease mus81 [Nowakowskiella sp. JEL0407]
MPPKNCANPLFCEWLHEWMEECRALAASGDSRSLKMQYVYKKAYENMIKYPLLLKTGKQCTIVQGVGPTIAKQLDDRLKAYKATAGGKAVDKSPKKTNSSVAVEYRTNSSVSTGIKLDLTSQNPKRTKETSPELEISDEILNQPVKKRRQTTTKEYIPAYRSGSYALVLALSTVSNPISKSELILIAQEFCDASFEATTTSATNTTNSLNYSAWSSMSTLLYKGLVRCKTGKTKRFELTEAGSELARKLKSASAEQPPAALSIYTNNDHSFISSSAFSSSSSSKTTSTPTLPVLKKNTSKFSSTSTSAPLAIFSNSCMVKITSAEFDIILVLDNREKRGRTSIQSFQEALNKKGVPVMTRALELGDICWVAKRKSAYGGPFEIRRVDEIMLDTLIERKTIQDLVSSIKDGRLKEQKYRLTNCGLSNVFYLVEENDWTEAHLMGMATVQTVMTSTQILDDLFLHQTSGTDDTIDFLALMTDMLRNIYYNREIKVLLPNDRDFDLFKQYRKEENSRHGLCIKDEHLTLANFSEMNTKTKGFSRRDVWARQLMAVKGMSAEKAAGMVEKYDSMRRLLDVFDEFKNPNPQLAFPDDAIGRKKLGPALCTKVVELFAKDS